MKPFPDEEPISDRELAQWAKWAALGGSAWSSPPLPRLIRELATARREVHRLRQLAIWVETAVHLALYDKNYQRAAELTKEGWDKYLQESAVSSEESSST